MDWSKVFDCIFHESLSKFLWILEDLGPFLNSCHISRHTLAIRKVTLKLLNHRSNFLNAFNDIRNVFFLEISNGSHEFTLKSISIFETGFNVFEFIFFDKSLEESCNKINDFTSIRSSKWFSISIFFSSSTVLVLIPFQFSVRCAAGFTIVNGITKLFPVTVSTPIIIIILL